MLSTAIYEVRRTVNRGWKLTPIAIFEGCPASIGSSPGGAALLVIATCSGLQQIDRRGARVLASWPRHLFPLQVVGLPGAQASQPVYHVSFGRVAARFSGASAEWFAPRECADITSGSDDRCACVASTP